MDKNQQDPEKSLTWPNHVLHLTRKNVEKTPRTLCIGLIYSLLSGKDWSSVKQDRMQSSFTTHSSAYCIPKVVVMGIWKNHVRESKSVSPQPPPKISFKNNWMKELGFRSCWKQQRYPTNPTKTKNPIIKNGGPVGEQPAGSFTQEIGKDVLFGREGTQNSRTERLVDGPTSIQSCVPESVELVEKDEDAGENVDADQTRTVSSVSGQSFTQLEEINIVLQSARIVTCSCGRSRKSPRSRAREENRQTSSSRSTSSRLAAEQRLKPIQQLFESDDPWNGQCKGIRVVRNNTKSAMFSMSSPLESRSDLLHLRTVLGWKRIQKKV